MSKILIIDDEPTVRALIKASLRDEGHSIIEAGTGPEGVACFDTHRPDMVFCDVVLPELDGIAVLKRIKSIDPSVPVVVMTGDGSTELAIRAMSLGASDFLIKPFGVRRTMQLVEDTLRSMQMETPAWDRTVVDPHDSQPLLGNSDSMYEVFKLIGRVAPQRLNVLVLGESGTGKELVARAVHQHGSQRDGAFVAVNCAAIPEALLESELFGHEKGAFTGAERQRIGKFELARNGTLFLDEIGDMSLAVQAKLLRVLQDQEFYRLGGTQSVRTSARIIAATNHDLRAEAASGKFREDLFYRLSGVTIRLPPLRERRDDIPLLATYFLRKSAQDLRRSVSAISPNAMQMLKDYLWPGNIRELSNVLQQSVLQAAGPTIISSQLECLIGKPTASVERPTTSAINASAIRDYVISKIGEEHTRILGELTEEFEREVMKAAVLHCEGNMSLAAKYLGIHRVTLKAKLNPEKSESTALAGSNGG